MAPLINGWWRKPPPGSGGGSPPPDKDDLAGPEPGEIKYKKSSEAGGNGLWAFIVDKLFTALGAVGSAITYLAVQWKWTAPVMLVAVSAAAVATGKGDLSTSLWQTAGVGFLVWIVAMWATIGPGPNPVPVTPPPGSGWLPEEENAGQEILAEMAVRNAERAAKPNSFWTPLRPVFRTSWERFVRFMKKVWKVGSGILLFLVVGAWELGKVIFTKPIDPTRSRGRRKLAWVNIGIMAGALLVAILLANPLWVRDRVTTASAAMPKFNLPQISWPWHPATEKQAVAPAPAPTPTLNPRAWGGGYRNKPVPAAAPTPAPRRSVAEIKSGSRQVLADANKLARETKQAKAQVEAKLAAIEAAKAAKTAAKATTPKPVPTTLVAAQPVSQDEVERRRTLAELEQLRREREQLLARPPATVGVPVQDQRLQAELVRARKERDEARKLATVAAAKPAPTPLTITRTATVGVPVLGPARLVERVRMVKVSVVKTVTKTVRVPGPERVVFRDRKVPGAIRTVTRTVKVPGATRVVQAPPTPPRVVVRTVLGPTRVVYRERPVVPATRLAGKGSDPSRLSDGKRVRPRQPATQHAGGENSSYDNPYGGSVYGDD